MKPEDIREEELALIYQETKSEDALTEMFKIRESTFQWIAHKHHKNPYLRNIIGSQDDFLSMIKISYINSVTEWNPDKSPLGPFIYQKLLWTFSNIIYKINNIPKRQHNGFVSLNAEIDDGITHVDVLESLYKEYLNEQDLEAVIDILKECFPKTSRDDIKDFVYHYYIGGEVIDKKKHRSIQTMISKKNIDKDIMYGIVLKHSRV